jgi:hypothetical protein
MIRNAKVEQFMDDDEFLKVPFLLGEVTSKRDDTYR